MVVPDSSIANGAAAGIAGRMAELSVGSEDAATAVSGSSSSSATKRNKQNIMDGCRLLALGGYSNDGTEIGTPMLFNEVWELTLSSSLKHVHTVCWGCGRADKGFKLCQGTCGGAVAICGAECQLRVWEEGHKHWCRKKL